MYNIIQRKGRPTSSKRKVRTLSKKESILKLLKYVLVGIACIFVVLMVFEIAICILRKVKRRRIYAMAKARSIETGLPLLVIGDPYNGIASIATGQDYGCGDVCMDLTGCSGCPVGIKGALEDILPQTNLTQYVVFISCVLEYVDDLPLIVKELETMNSHNLFVVNVEWYSLMAYFYPFFLTGEQPPKYIIYKCPPMQQGKLTYCRFRDCHN